MSALTNITNLAQDVYFSINGTENDDDGDDLTTFQNDFIRGFNLWLDEYETEAYWSKLRENGYELATISNTSVYSFELPEEYRTPIFNQNKYVKIVATDGTVLASFKLVDPSQTSNDDPDAAYTPNRAAFVGGHIVLSRAPNDTEVGSKLILDVVQYHPRLTTTDDSGIALLPSRQLAVYGISKNMTLSNVTKVALSPSFAQKYKNELDKQIAINNATNESYDAQFSNYGYVTGVW